MLDKGGVVEVLVINVAASNGRPNHHSRRYPKSSAFPNRNPKAFRWGPDQAIIATSETTCCVWQYSSDGVAQCKLRMFAQIRSHVSAICSSITRYVPSSACAAMDRHSAALRRQPSTVSASRVDGCIGAPGKPAGYQVILPSPFGRTRRATGALD